MRSPAATRWAGRTARPARRARPSSIQRRACARVTPARAARAWSSAEPRLVLAHEELEAARRAGVHHQIFERTARLRNTSTSTSARPKALVRSATSASTRSSKKARASSSSWRRRSNRSSASIPARTLSAL